MASNNSALEITLNDVVNTSKKCVTAVISEETIMMSIDTGTYGALDQIGGEILKRISQPISVANLCSELAREYSADLPTIQTDVLAFLRAMSQKQMIDVKPA